MRLMITLLGLAALFVSQTATAADSAYRIDHLEPASWWIGMHEPTLQLLVHGPAISELTPAIQAKGIELKKVTRTDNPNYLFLDLQISPKAAPGTVDIAFRRGQQAVLHYPYPLQARRAGSSQRQGFNSRDAIYLVVPDRFANGDPGNDTVAGMGDPLNRAAPGGRHGGDIQGIIDHLDYIAGMGFTQIWPTPLIENNAPAYSYHGYAMTDLYKIDPRFGSNEDLLRLVRAAKAKGLGVIQDVVLNHIGSGHWWLKDMPAKDWLNGWPKHITTNHAHTAIQDPYASQADKASFADGWFVDGMPDLNQRNPLLANYLIQNTLWWIEYADLSGLRVDTYPYSDKAFLSRWSQRIMAEYPHLNMVGEEWRGNPVNVAYWQRGKHNVDGYVSHLPSLMDFPLFYTLRQALTDQENWNSGLTSLYEMLANDSLYPDPFNLVLFDGNHDVSRLYSELGEDAGLTRMALTYVATMRGIPQYFYGTEILMTSPKQRDDGAVRADFPGGWAGDAVNAFTGAGLSPAQRETQDYLRKLLNWRKGAAAIHHGKLMHYAPADGIYTYFRYTKGAKVMVIINKNKTETQVDCRRFGEMLDSRAVGVDVISGQRYALNGALAVPARTAMVLEVSTTN